MPHGNLSMGHLKFLEMKSYNFFILLFCLLVITGLSAQNIVLDTDFNNQGYTETASVEEISLEVLKIQKDRKIVLGGIFNPSARIQGMVLFRYNDNGSLDSTFGEVGKITVNSNGWYNIQDIKILEKIKILVIGQFKEEANAEQSDLIFLQYNENGTIDTTYGDNGKLSLTSTEKFENLLYSVQYDENSTLLLFFNQERENLDELRVTKEFYIKRYFWNGEEDSNFGKIIVGNATDSLSFSSFIIQKDRMMTFLGTIGTKNQNGFLLKRFTPDGKIDESFGTSGRKTISFSEDSFHTPSRILQQSNGKILVLGSIPITTKSDFAMARINIDGSFDELFGTNGKVLTELTDNSSIIFASHDFASDLNQQSNGKILVTGSSASIAPPREKLVLVRYQADGKLDADFGADGILYPDLGNRYTSGNYLLSQNDRILIGGTSWENFYDDRQFLMVRYLLDFNVGIVNLNKNPNNILVYPNPIKNTAILEYNIEESEKLSIQLLDLQGRLQKTYLKNQFQEAGEHQQTIDLPLDLPKGIYFVKISSSLGQMMVKVISI